jgi:hypothetical protein
MLINPATYFIWGAASERNTLLSDCARGWIPDSGGQRTSSCRIVKMQSGFSDGGDRAFLRQNDQSLQNYRGYNEYLSYAENMLMIQCTLLAAAAVIDTRQVRIGLPGVAGKIFFKQLAPVPQ